eukprot:Nk52_evm16s251 gene=Nk52_evmTU16s251
MKNNEPVYEHERAYIRLEMFRDDKGYHPELKVAVALLYYIICSQKDFEPIRRILPKSAHSLSNEDGGEGSSSGVREPLWCENFVVASCQSGKSRFKIVSAFILSLIHDCMVWCFVRNFGGSESIINLRSKMDSYSRDLVNKCLDEFQKRILSGENQGCKKYFVDFLRLALTADTDTIRNSSRYRLLWGRLFRPMFAFGNANHTTPSYCVNSRGSKYCVVIDEVDTTVSTHTRDKGKTEIAMSDM